MKTIHDTKWIMTKAWNLVKNHSYTLGAALKLAWRMYRVECKTTGTKGMQTLAEKFKYWTAILLEKGFFLNDYDQYVIGFDGYQSLAEIKLNRAEDDFVITYELLHGVSTIKK